jgi:predicted DNA-binding protein
MRTRHTFRLPPELAKRLAELSARQGVPQALIVESALMSFLSPDGADRLEAALARRLAPGASLPEELGTAIAATGIDPLMVAMETVDAYDGVVAEVEAQGLWDPAPMPEGASILMATPFGFRWIATGADFEAWLPVVEEIEVA